MVRASAREHADAILVLIRAAGVTAGLAEAASDASPPYVVLHPDPGHGAGGAIGDPSAHFRLDFQLTAVGESAEQALWVSDRACSAVNRAVPAVSGRAPWPVWADERPQPVRRDDTVTPPLFIAVTRWCLRTEPA